VITGVATEWPAMKRWDPEYFIRVGDGKPFHAGGLAFQMQVGPPRLNGVSYER
jgi:hypothetical protein